MPTAFYKPFDPSVHLLASRIVPHQAAAAANRFCYDAAVTSNPSVCETTLEDIYPHHRVPPSPRKGTYAAVVQMIADISVDNLARITGLAEHNVDVRCPVPSSCPAPASAVLACRMSPVPTYFDSAALPGPSLLAFSRYILHYLMVAAFGCCSLEDCCFDCSVSSRQQSQPADGGRKAFAEMQTAHAGRIITYAAALMLRFQSCFWDRQKSRRLADDEPATAEQTGAENGVASAFSPAPLLPLNVHRMLLAAICVSSKLLTDWAPPSTGGMAGIGGVSTPEMARLEVAFLSVLSWRTAIDMKEFRSVLDAATQRATARHQLHHSPFCHVVPIRAIQKQDGINEAAGQPSADGVDTLYQPKVSITHQSYSPQLFPSRRYHQNRHGSTSTRPRSPHEDL